MHNIQETPAPNPTVKVTKEDQTEKNYLPI